MVQEAIEKIDKELGEASNSYERYIANYLKDNLTVKTAEKIMDEKKTIQGCYKSLEDIARKKKTGNCYAMPPTEVHENIEKYYGIDEKVIKPEDDNKIVNIMDLM